MPHEITLDMPIPDSTHTIVANITKSITEFVAEKTKGSTSHRQVLGVLHSSEIPSILTRAILTSIDAVSSEVTMSLIADVMAVSRRFTRELHDSYTKNSKKEFDPQLAGQAIARAVEIVFPDDNNVLESISKKQMMLHV